MSATARHRSKREEERNKNLGFQSSILHFVHATGCLGDVGMPLVLGREGSHSGLRTEG